MNYLLPPYAPPSTPPPFQISFYPLKLLLLLPYVLLYPFLSLSAPQPSVKIATICFRGWSHNMSGSRASNWDTWLVSLGPVTLATPAAQNFTFTSWHWAHIAGRSLLSVSSPHPSILWWCKSSPLDTFSPETSSAHLRAQPSFNAFIPAQ